MAKGGELIFDSDPIWHNIKSDFKLVCLSDCGIKSRRRLLYYQLPPTTTSSGAIFYGVIVYLCPPASILFSYPSVAVAAVAIPRLVMDEDEDEDELCIDRSLGRNTHPHTS